MEQSEIRRINSAECENTDDVELLERKHFQNVINSFRCYRIHSCRSLNKSMKYISLLPKHQQEMLRGHRKHLSSMRICIDHNYEIIKLILKEVPHMFENTEHTDDKSHGICVSPNDMEKVQAVFKQIHREWSTEGQKERESSFDKILKEVEFRFPVQNVEDRQNIKVLVPGTGLGRLAFELAKQGYACQGNECSLFMLFVSNFILNKCQGANLYTIYPWVHQCFNNLKSEDQVRAVVFPDVIPSDLPPHSNFSMAAGNFIELYYTPDAWDCIATCFFLDTANNILDYIETIWKILKPGGYWINLGPLLYHHADMPNQDSIEPSYEEIKKIIEATGFQYLVEDTCVETPYCQNPKAMLAYVYKSVYFVCTKPSLENIAVVDIS